MFALLSSFAHYIPFIYICVQDYPGIYTCSMQDGLDTIFETIRKSRVHRLIVIDDHQRLQGILSLGDILEYILLDGEDEDEDEAS